MPATFPTGTKQWADDNLNVCLGCANNCRYCYARAMAARFHRRDPADWAREEIVPNWHRRLPRSGTGPVMLPSTHDLTPGTYDAIRRAITLLLGRGRTVLLVTKARPGLIRQLTRHFWPCRHQIEIRVTIGSLDPTILLGWEPGAPGPEERISALAIARHADFPTSVSIEPMLDDHPLAIVARVDHLVTRTIWLGLPNRLRSILSTNGFKDDAPTQLAADDLLAAFSDDYLLALDRQVRGYLLAAAAADAVSLPALKIRYKDTLATKLQSLR
jgi:hypothetical protein